MTDRQLIHPLLPSDEAWVFSIRRLEWFKVEATHLVESGKNKLALFTGSDFLLADSWGVVIFRRPEHMLGNAVARHKVNPVLSGVLYYAPGAPGTPPDADFSFDLVPCIVEEPRYAFGG